MKKVYNKPLIEIEAYQLDASIAGSCGTAITLGPGDYAGKVCDEFGLDPFGIQSIQANENPFYDGTEGIVCDCYYTSGNNGYFTS